MVLLEISRGNIGEKYHVSTLVSFMSVPISKQYLEAQP